MNRSLTEERIKARELAVFHGLPLTDIASETGVHIETIRSWAKKDDWTSEREEIITTPVEIGERLKKLIVRLMDEIDEKLDSGEGISDLTLQRLDRYTKSLTRLDRNYDDKGAIILAMRKLIRFLSSTKNKEGIKLLNSILPDFYRSLREE